MTVLARLYNFVAGTPAVADEVDSEFNQIVDMLAGTSSTKNAVIRMNSGTVPPLTLNQIGAGPVADFQVAGSSKVTVTTGGTVQATAVPAVGDDLTNKSYVDARKITTNFTVFKTGALSVSALLFPVYIVGDGLTSPAAISMKFVHKTNTTVGVTTITIVRRRAGANTTVTTLTVPDSTPVNTVVTNNFADDSLLADDILTLDVTAVGGTPPSDASITLYFEQKVRS